RGAGGRGASGASGECVLTDQASRARSYVRWARPFPIVLVAIRRRGRLSLVSPNRRSPAPRNRGDGQPQLVDQVVLHQCPDERAAGVHDDLPLCLLLQLRDLADYLAPQDGRIGPFGLLEGRGHYVLRQAVQPVDPLAALRWRPCAEVLVAPAT